jgi:hypothetical protein
VRQHRTIEERCAAAREAATRLGLRMPLLADGMADTVSEAFAAWPERISVVDPDGALAYVGAPGPWGFDPQAAGDALAALLEAPR